MSLFHSDFRPIVLHVTPWEEVASPSSFLGRLIVFLLISPKSEVNRISINLKGGILVTTTRQVKAARALLGWSQADLARRSGISEPTIARLESSEGELGGREGTGKKIRKAIEIAGVEFIDENGGGPDENGGGPGVRLRKRQPKRG